MQNTGTDSEGIHTVIGGQLSEMTVSSPERETMTWESDQSSLLLKGREYGMGSFGKKCGQAVSVGAVMALGMGMLASTEVPRPRCE